MDQLKFTIRELERGKDGWERWFNKVITFEELKDWIDYDSQGLGIEDQLIKVVENQREQIVALNNTIDRLSDKLTELGREIYGELDGNDSN